MGHTPTGIYSTLWVLSWRMPLITLEITLCMSKYPPPPSPSVLSFGNCILQVIARSFSVNSLLAISSEVILRKLIPCLTQVHYASPPSWTLKQSQHMANNDLQWQSMTNNDKQRQKMANNGKQWQTMTKNDKQRQTMTNNAKQWQKWQKVTNNDKQWQTVTYNDKQWQTRT